MDCLFTVLVKFSEHGQRSGSDRAATSRLCKSVTIFSYAARALLAPWWGCHIAVACGVSPPSFAEDIQYYLLLIIIILN